MIRVTTCVFCDKCGNWVEVDIGPWEMKRREARQKVKELGWQTKRHPETNGFIDLCPGCQER